MSAIPTYITEKDAVISVTLKGVTWPSNMKSWQTFEGGDPSAATSQLHPGGLATAVALPGPQTRTNVTVTAPYTTDLDAIRASIDAATNQGMTAAYTPRDADGNINGATTSYTGLLKEVQWPKADAKSGNPGVLGLVMECNF